jgi:hypothetical protein
VPGAGKDGAVITADGAGAHYGDLL